MAGRNRNCARCMRYSLAAPPSLSMLIVGLIAAILLLTAVQVPSAYADGGDEATTQTQSQEFGLHPIDRVLKSIFGAKATGPDEKRQERAGKRVGLQAGHWRYNESPPPLNTHTGGSGGGKTEPEVTLDIARRAADILESMGYSVEILPAWFPRGYTADAFVAIHSDGAANPQARGFFAERYGYSSVPEVDDRFMAVLNEEYSEATGIPFKYRSTANSRYYYGFTLIRARTPAVLIETGFLSNEEDRQIIVDSPDRAARGIANGVDRFLVP